MSGADSRLRVALLALPWLVALAVGATSLVLARPEAATAARVYAATSEPGRLSVRLARLRLQSGQWLPADGCVRWVSDGLRLSGCSNAEGMLDLNAALPAPLGPDARFSIEATDASSAPLATGTGKDLPAGPAEPVRRGGWIPGQAAGEVVLRVGIVQGVLAVPFAARLRLEASLAGKPLAGVQLNLTASGAHLKAKQWTTDAAGVAIAELTAEGHVVDLAIDASLPNRAEGPTTGRWFGVLPVVPGALWATREGSELVVRSAVPRSMAYVNLVSPRGVVQSLSLPLREDGTLHSARAALPVSEQPRFAVVSSEPDMQSMAVVGWPLPSADDASVQATWETRNVLVADGAAQHLARAEQRNRRWRQCLAAFVVAAAVIEGLLLYAVLRRASQLQRRRLSAPDGWGGVDVEREAGASVPATKWALQWWTGALIGCVVAAVSALALLF